jgi:hypothetical protein
MLEKIVLPVKDKRFTEMEYKGSTIWIDPYITLKNQTELIRNYISSYFQDDDIVKNYIEAEGSMVLQILDKQTNILVVEDD